jgi:hypothetical protein
MNQRTIERTELPPLDDLFQTFKTLARDGDMLLWPACAGDGSRAEHGQRPDSMVLGEHYGEHYQVKHEPR